MSKFKCEGIGEPDTVDIGSMFLDIGCRFLDSTENEGSNYLAAIWFALGTLNGNKSAQTNLGLLLTEGRGLPEDLEKGLALLRSAAEAGVENAKEAIYFLTTPEDEYVCECCRKLKLN